MRRGPGHPGPLLIDGAYAALRTRGLLAARRASGALTGNDDLKAEGAAEQASAKAEQVLDDAAAKAKGLVEGAADAAEGAIDAVKDKLS